MHDFNVPLLENLESINIGYNNISRLPENLPRLTRLKELRIGSNYIIEIPKEVVCHANLKKLEVTPNPLERPPLATCERGFDAMKRHYQSFKEKNRTVRKSKMKRTKETPLRKAINSSPSMMSIADSVVTASSYSSFEDTLEDQLLNDTLRVIVVGSAMAGKTSCINGIKSSGKKTSASKDQGENERQPFHPDRTIGVDISKWGISDISAEIQNLKLNFWDFAGQEVYHVRIFFMTFIFCWLLSESLKQFIFMLGHS